MKKRFRCYERTIRILEHTLRTRACRAWLLSMPMPQRCDRQAESENRRAKEYARRAHATQRSMSCYPGILSTSVLFLPSK